MQQEAEAKVLCAVTALPRMAAGLHIPRDLENFCFLLQMDLGGQVECVPSVALQNRK